MQALEALVLVTPCPPESLTRPRLAVQRVSGAGMPMFIHTERLWPK